MEGLFGKYRVLLAPMAGVSDIAFRTLCREAGMYRRVCELQAELDEAVPQEGGR